MTTTSEAPSKGSKIKDLVVTAAVASVVSAVLYPWMRRWLDPITSGIGPPPQPSATPPAGLPADEFEARLARLLEVPDPFAPEHRHRPSHSTTRRNDHDADDDDLEP